MLDSGSQWASVRTEGERVCPVLLWCVPHCWHLSALVGGSFGWLSTLNRWLRNHSVHCRRSREDIEKEKASWACSSSSHDSNHSVFSQQFFFLTNLQIFWMIRKVIIGCRTFCSWGYICEAVILLQNNDQIVSDLFWKYTHISHLNQTQSHPLVN